jgi:hypothetical protein
MSYLVAAFCHRKVIVMVTTIYSAIPEQNAVVTFTELCRVRIHCCHLITCCDVSQLIGILDITSFAI